MYLEYNWTALCWQPRFGQTFTSVDGQRSFADLAEAKHALSRVGLKLGKKTDTRTYEIVEVQHG